MNIKDYNPFISVLELFGILLPGSIVSLLLIYHFGNTGLDGFGAFLIEFQKHDAFIFGLLFILASYFLGQLTFQLGYLLDDIIYDPFKDYLFKNTGLKEVLKLKALDEQRINERGTLNAYYWSYYKIQSLRSVLPLQEVDRLTAQSKFFRAVFVITMLYCFIHSIFKWREQEIVLILCIIISLLVFQVVLRYYKLKRLKVKELLRKCYFWIFISSVLCYCFAISIHKSNLYFDSSFFFDFIKNRNGHDYIFLNSELLKNLLIYLLIPILSLAFYLRVRSKSIKTLYRYIIFHHSNLPN